MTAALDWGREREATAGVGVNFVASDIFAWTAAEPYDNLPAPADWVPLLVMALVVGVFESIFFRGFVQNRLEEQFGPVIGLALAAALYGAYHLGYGMGADEMLFLAGLGVVYAVAFALTRNVLALWPLLTPLGSFYNAVDTGDIDLPGRPSPASRMYSR